MLELLIDGGVAIMASVVTWLLAKRKYDVEVKGDELDNLRKQLDLYKDLVEDTRKQLNSYIEMCNATRKEVFRLQSIVNELYPLACQIKECKSRKKVDINKIKGE